MFEFERSSEGSVSDHAPSTAFQSAGSSWVFEAEATEGELTLIDSAKQFHSAMVMAAEEKLLNLQMSRKRGGLAGLLVVRMCGCVHDVGCGHNLYEWEGVPTSWSESFVVAY